MIQVFNKISEISVIDQDSENNILSFSEIEYEDTIVGSGGFGSIHKIKSIDNNDKNGLLLKILNDQTKSHAFETIALFHDKINKLLTESGVPLYHKYPELLGFPFMAFKAFNNDNKEIFGLIMFNLSDLYYESFGDDSNQRNIISDLKFPEKLHLCYQLARVITFLHKIKFIHADISDNAIWINNTTGKIALIDFDSGYHFDSQPKPSTFGKLTHYITDTFRKLIRDVSNGLGGQLISENDRINEENWILANAIFEILTSVTPFVFLTDVYIIKNYLVKNKWPEINSNSELLNKNNLNAQEYILGILTMLNESGLDFLTSAFKKVFNNGYANYKSRNSAQEWTEILFKACKTIGEPPSPMIDEFSCNKKIINKKNDEVTFKWITSRDNEIYLDGKLMPQFVNSATIKLEDEKIVKLKVINDFGIAEKAIKIKAYKVEPLIKSYKASKEVRETLDPIMLTWEVDNSREVHLSTFSKTFESNGFTYVTPVAKTTYFLTAIGYFDQHVTAQLDILVIHPAILEFSGEINLDLGLDNVDIHWNVLNAQSIKIEPKIGVKNNFCGIEHVSIPEPTEFTLTAKGYFATSEKKIIVHPFPIPVIKSILTETPRLELNFNFDTEALRVPGNVYNSDNLYFHNSISFNDRVNPDLFIKPDVTKLNIPTPLYTESNALLENVSNNEFSFKKAYSRIVRLLQKT